MFGLFSKKFECVGCRYDIEAKKNKEPDQVLVYGNKINLHGPGKCPKCKMDIVLIEDNGKFETQFKLLFDAEVEFSKKEKEYEDAIVALEDKFDNEEIDKSLYNKEKEKIEKNLEKAEKILEKVSIKVSKIEEKLLNKF